MENDIKMKKKNIVYVLGAGASHASENNFKNVKNPTDTGFWKAVYELGVLEKGTFLYRFLQLFFGEKICVGMEDVYTLIDSYISILKLGGIKIPDHLDAQDDTGRSRALLRHLTQNEDFNKLIYDYIDISDIHNSSRSFQYLLFFEEMEKGLIDLINNVFRTINSNWDCELHRRFGKLIKEQHDNTFNTTIISFNYDLLVDKAFASEGLSINKDYSYYLWLHQFVSYDKRDPKNLIMLLQFRRPKDIPDNNIELLKLHGSLNWFALYYLNQNIDSPKHIFYQDLGRLEEFINRECNVQFAGWPEPYSPKIEKMKISRVIIPPIIEKLRKFKSGASFESLWRRAFEKLMNADKVVFVGYSMPQADYLAKWLFQTACRLNPRLKPGDIHLFLTGEKDDKDTVEKYKAIFGDGITYHDNQNFQSFVGSDLAL